MSELRDRISRNLSDIRQRMAAAAKRSGRTAEDVRLVAVTKYVDVEAATALVQLGCRQLGESRPQELWKKAAEMTELDVEWHLIGHLQRNKARRTLPLVSLLHSVDSLRLLNELNKCAGPVDQTPARPVQALLEVNISSEPEKHGFRPQEVEPLLPQIADYGLVQVQGLMAMAARGSQGNEAKRQFAELRELRDRLQPNCPESIRLNELSMGMSGDYEAAIEEGATLVRVGSALFS